MGPPKTKRKFKKPPIKSIDNKIVDSLRSLNIEREKINKADDLMGLYDVEHNSNINRSIRDNSIRNNSIIQDDADAEEEMDQPDEELFVIEQISPSRRKISKSLRSIEKGNKKADLENLT